VSPHYANAHFQLGKALVAQGRFDEAREAYLAAIDDGNYAALQFVIDDQVYIWKAHSEIGSSYVMQRDDEKAVEWFEKGLKNAPNAEPLHVNRARALERLGRLEAASEAYRTVYELHGSASATIEYVNALLRRGREREACSLIDETQGKFPPETALSLLMAGAAVAARSSDSGLLERYLRAAAAIKPGSAQILNPLEATLRKAMRMSEIEELLAREDSAPPEEPADFLRRSQRAANQSRFEDGAALARAGLELDPSDGNLLYASAFCSWHLGDDAAALHSLSAIVPATNELAIARESLRAQIHQKRGDVPQTVVALDALLSLDPYHIDGLLSRASLMGEQGRLDEEERSLKRAYEHDPARTAVPLSSFYLRVGRFEEAARVAGQALGT
jgi:tetratricopeptide (TPR) repeat protein